MVYETAGRRAARALGAIRAALGDAEGLILATDPDRKGEAIAWQVLTWLREKDALGDKPVERVAFREITAEGVRAAMARPRGLDMDLVQAQQARRALDYLVGYGLSPLMWRKAPVGRSGAVGGAAPRLRARGGDRGLRPAGILDRGGGGLGRAPDGAAAVGLSPVTVAERAAMKKSEMAERVAGRMGLSKSAAEGAVDAVFETIVEALAREEAVRIAGFGTFATRSRSARTGRNPQTGESIAIPASKAPSFKAGKALRAAVNEGREAKPDRCGE